jgi:hypothetical protein
MRAVRPDFEARERHGEVVLGACERGEVVDEVERLVDEERLRHVVRDERERVVVDVLDVRRANR